MQGSGEQQVGQPDPPAVHHPRVWVHLAVSNAHIHPAQKQQPWYASCKHPMPLKKQIRMPFNRDYTLYNELHTLSRLHNINFPHDNLFVVYLGVYTTDRD